MASPSRRRAERGVTIVELAVVVGILAVLAAVVLVSIGGIRDRQRTSACTTELRKLRTSVAAYEALPKPQNPTGGPPRDLATLKATGLLDERSNPYVSYSRIRSGGRYVAKYANGPKGNCVPG